MDTIKIETPEFQESKSKLEDAIGDVEAIQVKSKPGILHERYYSESQICEMFYLGKRGLQNYRDEDIIPYTKIGDKILYRVSDIIKILERIIFSVLWIKYNLNKFIEYKHIKTRIMENPFETLNHKIDDLLSKVVVIIENQKLINKQSQEFISPHLSTQS